MEQQIASFFRDSLRIREYIARFSDIRKNLRIPLKNILVSLLLMSFWATTSLLALDKISRKRQVKMVFDRKRKRVTSDSTVACVLKWLDGTLAAQLLQGIGTHLNRLGYLKRRLSAEGHPRRIGILVNMHRSSGWGWLVYESKHLSSRTFSTGDNPDFREILRDAQTLFTPPHRAVDSVESAQGFDPENKRKVRRLPGNYLLPHRRLSPEKERSLRWNLDRHYRLLAYSRVST